MYLCTCDLTHGQWSDTYSSMVALQLTKVWKKIKLYGFRTVKIKTLSYRLLCFFVFLGDFYFCIESSSFFKSSFWWTLPLNVLFMTSPQIWYSNILHLSLSSWRLSWRSTEEHRRGLLVHVFLIALSLARGECKNTHTYSHTHSMHVYTKKTKKHAHLTGQSCFS